MHCRSRRNFLIRVKRSRHRQELQERRNYALAVKGSDRYCSDTI